MECIAKENDMIEKPFKLVTPNEQDDPAIENYVWAFKPDKEPGSWGHFWNQYGIFTCSD